MAKIVLTINANNNATESVRHLNKEIGILKSTLPTIQVNKNLTTQINALTKHYTALAKAAVRVNEATTKRQIAEQRLANEVKRGRTEDQRTLKVKAQKEQAELRLKQAQDKATQSTQKQTNATKQNTEVNKEHRQSILSMTRGILEWQIATTLVMKPLRMLQNALQSINETLVTTEDRVIELQRVVGDVANANQLYDLATKYGQTFENVSEATLNFARRGMSWNESLKATEAALLAINVAELDVGQATDGLGAIMAQFGIQASELTNVVDMLNKTADKFPVTTEKILMALQRTGSTASTANLSLEETIGLITTLSKSTNRSGENIGTALNSILNIAQKDSTLETFSKLGDSVASVVEQYRGGGTSILEVLRVVSTEVQNLNTHQIFDSEAFNALNEDLKESMGEDFEMLQEIYGTAGTYRRNYFIALLNDLDTVKQVENEISDAQGYSQAENQKYLDTYTARQNSVQAKWQKIANDAQGVLGLKKNLLGAADVVLTLINYTGKLNTVFLLAGAAVNKLVSAKLADSLAKQITSWSSLSRVVNAQAKPAVINYTAEIRRLKAEILTTVDSTALLEKQQKLLEMRQQRLATAFKGLSTAISAALIVFAAVNAIQGAIDQAREDRIEKEQEELRVANEKIAKSVESIDENKKLAQSTSEYANTVKDLRETLDSSTASESEKQSAQSQLLSIQNSLIESNNSYADSLDLINGKLVEQLELVEKMSDAQLKKQAQQFLDSNYAEIANANSAVNNSSSTSVEFLTGSAFDNDKNKAFIQRLIQKAKEQGIELGADDYVNVPTSWTGPITYYEEQIRKAANGQETTVWDWLGFTAIKDMFSKEGWEGSSWAGISASGTVDEQLKNLRAFRQLIIDNDNANTLEELGLTKKEAVSFVEELDKAIAKLDTTEYQNAKTLAEKAKATKDFIAGTISREEYLKIVYGIESDIVKEEEIWHNNIAKVTNKYDSLISKLEELRDLQKESTEWEEKKLAVMESEQALENAKNEATVRRFNEATGQWEWQTDEKKIAEAEKNLEQAQLNLQEAAYNNIIDQLKEQTATNDGILAILKEVAPLLGEDFSNAVQNAIKDKTGVDITQPVITPSESHDNGGLALGKGFINKATDRPESVNNPELTKKILSPVSNAEFNRYVRDMGIMFERSHQYAQMPVIERVGGAVDNRVNNSGQVFIQGVNVGAEKRDGIMDALALAPLMSDN